MTRIDEHQSSKLTFAESAAPATPAAGLVYIYAKTDGLLYQKDDAGVETLVGSGASMSNPMTTAGDIIYSSDGSGTPARLGVGSNGQVLTLAAGLPSWAAAAGGSAPDCYESFLTSPVTIVNANTAYNGPSISLGAGDWKIDITMSFQSAHASPTHLVAQIYDGTSVVADASGYHGGGASGGATFSCSARITLAGTTTVYARGVSIRGSSDSTILATALANGATNKATSIRALAITSA